MRTLFLLLTVALGLATPSFAQTIDRIRETGELKLGYRQDAAPLSSENAEGNATGYSPLVCVGVAKAVAKQLGMDDLAVSFHPVTTEDRFEKISNGEIDLLCGAATITLERRKIVDFSVPTYVDGSVVLLPRDASSSFKALDGKRIGVRSGTTTSTMLDNTIEEIGISAEQVPFESHDVGVEALRKGEIDAYFGDQSILVYQFLTKKLEGELQITNKLLTIEPQGLAMARGDSNFRLLVDAILSNMYRTGAMQRAYEQTLPGIQPGQAMKAMHVIAPILP